MSHVIRSNGNSAPFGLPFHALHKFNIIVRYFLASCSHPLDFTFLSPQPLLYGGLR